MSDDPYTILGVEKTASEKDIKSAYKKLAKKLHPDLNPGDKTAEEKFKQVSAAHDLLKDKDKRARYDAGEIDAQGQEKPRRQYYRDFADAGAEGAYHSAEGYGDFDDLSGVFSDLFGRGARARRAQSYGAQGETFRMRGRDALYTMEVDFLEAINGASKRITLPTGDTLDVKLPAGTADGQTIRLRGKGGPGIGGGPDGDALVEISVRPDPNFRREGNDIHTTLALSIDEAILGGPVEMPTVSGKVRMKIPPGSSTGKTLRLKGKGVKGGDQHVTLEVVLPEKIDDDLREFMAKWRTGHAYDPRKGAAA